jgi:hypothetical protein
MFMIKRFSFLLVVVAVSALINGCAHSIKVERVPKGAEYEGSPMFDQFDTKEVSANARKILGYTGPLEVVTVNSEVEDEDLLAIVGALKQDLFHGQPAVCLSRDARFIANAIERGLKKYPEADLTGLRFVVAAPKDASKKFQEALSKRHIEYHYLNVMPAGPYGHDSK